MQALEELQRKNLLVYNQTSWEWNIGITDDDEISISDNIVRAIESKLKQLPQDLQDVLSIAAYVRATFDVTTLLYVVQNEQQCAGASPFFATTSETVAEEYFSNLLENAVLKQLLSNPIGDAKYRFVHDRVQEAAHSMVSHGEERNKLRLRIGHCFLRLYRGNDAIGNAIPGKSTKASTPACKKTSGHRENIKVSSEDDHGLLFVAADHLNSVPTKDHMFSVMLNLEVGEQAIQTAALASAAGYLERAANELKLVYNPWEEHYDISL